MKKTPTIFKRDEKQRNLVTDEPNPVCSWVFDGEGVATRKIDGTCCLVDGGALMKRRELKNGEPYPEGFVECDFDEETGKRVGWMHVSITAPEDKYHVEALKSCGFLADGTYELVGPKVQGNPERYANHILIKHSSIEQYPSVPRTYEGIKMWLTGKDIEGLVFHHPDGRMAKIKLRDFGLKRKP